MNYPQLVKVLIASAMGICLIIWLPGCADKESTSTSSDAPQSQSSTPEQPPQEKHFLSNEQEVLRLASEVDGMLQADAKEKKEAIKNAN